MSWKEEAARTRSRALPEAKVKQEEKEGKYIYRMDQSGHVKGVPPQSGHVKGVPPQSGHVKGVPYNGAHMHTTSTHTRT